MLNMSGVINSLKYEHEYYQLLKTLVRLYDKNSFFLFGEAEWNVARYTTNKCAVLNLFCTTISTPSTSCSKLR